MTSKRLFFVLLGLLVLMSGLGIAGTVYGSKVLQRQSSELQSLKSESEQLQKQQTSLVQAKKDIEKYAELESIVKRIVPQEKDQARTTREIVKLAEESRIKIATITFPSSSLGQAAPKTSTPAAGGAKPPVGQTQVEAVAGISGLYEMEVSVQSDGGSAIPFTNLVRFLEKLEQNRRTAQVKNLVIQPDAENRQLVTFNLILSVYIKP